MSRSIMKCKKSYLAKYESGCRWSPSTTKYIAVQVHSEFRNFVQSLGFAKCILNSQPTVKTVTGKNIDPLMSNLFQNKYYG